MGQSSAHLLWDRPGCKKGAVTQSREPGPWSQVVISLCLSFPLIVGWLQGALEKMKMELRSSFCRWTVLGRALRESTVQGNRSRQEQLPSGWLGFRPPPSPTPAPWEGSALASEFGFSSGSGNSTDLQPAPMLPLSLQASLPAEVSCPS